MNALLICPRTRPGMEFLADGRSLSCVPLLGRGIVEYWLSHFACAGTKEVLILADEFPNEVRTLVSNGDRWGLKAEVIEEQRELEPEEALLKYGQRLDPAVSSNRAATLDHFPGLPEVPLFENYKQWFEALKNWMPMAKTPDRVGVQERESGARVGLNCHISPQAELHGPCWIGENVFIGARAVVGPGAVIEDGAFIEAGALVTNSIIAADTFVGQFAEINGSYARGDTLVNIETGSAIRVPDRFLLCALRQNRTSRKTGFLSRLGELCDKAESNLLWKHSAAQ